MTAPSPATELERTLTTVEEQLEEALALASDADARLRALEATPPTRLATWRSVPPPPPAAQPDPTPPLAPGPLEVPLEPPVDRPLRAPAPVADAASLSDFLGGRALAWLGGIATVLGIVLLLALAIAHGWIGREARVVLAGAGSSALLAAGIWLRSTRSHRGGGHDGGSRHGRMVRHADRRLRGLWADPRAGGGRRLDAARRTRDGACNPLGWAGHRGSGTDRSAYLAGAGRSRGQRPDTRAARGRRGLRDVGCSAGAAGRGWRSRR